MEIYKSLKSGITDDQFKANSGGSTGFISYYTIISQMIKPNEKAVGIVADEHGVKVVFETIK